MILQRCCGAITRIFECKVRMWLTSHFSRETSRSCAMCTASSESAHAVSSARGAEQCARRGLGGIQGIGSSRDAGQDQGTLESAITASAVCSALAPASRRRAAGR